MILAHNIIISNLLTQYYIISIWHVKDGAWSLVNSHFMLKFQYKFGELTSHQTPSLMPNVNNNNIVLVNSKIVIVKSF
jgi:hypothetical protein